VRWYASCGLVGALLGGGLAYAVTPLLPTTYTAQAQVVVRSPSEVTVFGNAVNVNVSTVSMSAAQVLRSQEVSIAASELLDGRLTPAQVQDQVSVSTGTNSPVVTVEATATTGELAQALANAVPQAYLDVESDGYAERATQTEAVLGQLRKTQVDRLAAVQAELATKAAYVQSAAPPFINPADRANWVQATLETDIDYQRLQNEAATLTSSISETDNTLQQSDVDFAILESGVDRIIGAQLPRVATSPVLMENVVVGVLVGLLAGAGIAWRATERRRAIDAGSAAGALGAPLLGRFGPERQLRRFPRFADFSTDATPGNELKVLTSSLLLSARRKNIGSVVITSARTREGKSTLAANIAAAAEYTGHQVALVDASTTRPTVSENFGLAGAPGLSEVLDGGPLANSLHLLPYVEGRNLPIVPTGIDGGRDEPGRRLSEERRAVWANTFGGTSKLTAVVDAPAVNDHPLPLQLAGAGVLVVVVSPRTTVFDLEVMRNRAEAADVTVLGFIINEFRAPRRRPPLNGNKDRRRKSRQRGRQAERRPLAIGAGSS
jgi:capsular polysaccharide biosynthesis protein/Mrp family chromosome partitioning ATPase